MDEGGGEVVEWWDLLGQRVEILHGGLRPPLIGPQHLSQGGRCGWMAAAQGGGSPTLAGGDGGRGRAKSCRHSFGPNPHRSSISREDTLVLNNSRACLPPSPPPTRRKRGRGRDAFEDETRDYLTLGGPEVLLLLGWEGPALGVGVGGAR